MAARLKIVQDGITPRLQAMINRAKSVQSFLNSTIYTMYQNLQLQRWMTEGSSEGNGWPALNSTYAQYKLRRYGGGAKFKWIGGMGEGRPWEPDGSWPSSPGGGTKMMIGTTRLVSAVVGPNDSYNEGLRFHRKMVDAKSIRISVDTSQTAGKKDPGSCYFEYALVARDYVFFSQSHVNEMKAALKAYVKKGAA